MIGEQDPYRSRKAEAVATKATWKRTGGNMKKARMNLHCAGKMDHAEREMKADTDSAKKKVGKRMHAKPVGKPKIGMKKKIAHKRSY